MDVFKLLLCCCVGSDHASCLSEKRLAADTDHVTAYQDSPSDAEIADKIVAKLLKAERNDAILKADLQSTIHAYGWRDDLAAAVLIALEKAIKLGEEMGPAIKEAYEKAVAAFENVKEWIGEHPKMAAAGVVVTLIALGVLVIMMPWLMAWLGFAEEGIVAESWAAVWQATYRGFVPKRSLFSFLQSLGTKIGRKWLD